MQQLTADDEIDLRELWNVIWREKWIILAVTALFAVVSIIHALKQPNLYTATSLLVPTASESNGGLGGLAAQYGGLAAIAGINLNKGGGSGKVTVALELLKDWNFIDQFIRKYQLEMPIFAGRGWDSQTDQLVIDSNLYDQETNTWLTGVKPSSWQLYNAFSSFVVIDEDKIKGVIHLSVEYFSPGLAAEWNRLLIKEVNEYMREKDFQKANNNIEFLREQIKETSIKDLQTVFFRLIEEQTKVVMLAKANEEYVLNTVGAAKAPEQRSKPKRTVIVLLGTTLGMVFALVIVFIRRTLKRN